MLKTFGSLAAMLAQTDRFGTSIGQAPALHAESSRTAGGSGRRSVPGKSVRSWCFAGAVASFPALYIVRFGPAAIRILACALQLGGPGKRWRGT